MNLSVITPPAPLVLAADAKSWQPVFGADSDARVNALLIAAQAGLEPPNGWLGRALGVQTLEVQAAHWGDCGVYPMWRDHGELRIPCPPLRSVVSVRYVDIDGVERTIPAEEYEVFGLGSAQGAVRRVGRTVWPSVYGSRSDAVRIRFEAGYDAADPQLMPVKQAIVLAASHLRSLGTQDLALRSREIEGVGTRTWTISDAAQKIVASTVEGLLLPLRVYS